MIVLIGIIGMENGHHGFLAYALGVKTFIRKDELGSATGRLSFKTAEVHAMVTRAFWAPTNLMDLSYNRLQECTMVTRRVPTDSLARMTG